MKRQDTNYAVVTGILINKERNANSDELKRPVLDLELIRESNGEVFFEPFPIVICDVTIAKPVAGYKLGDILTVQGTIRSTEDGNTYLEADDIARVQKSSIGEPKTVEYALSRIELAQMSPRFNLGILVGKIQYRDKGTENEIMVVQVPRLFLSHGNLQAVDEIGINSSDFDISFSDGDEVLCMGEFGSHNSHPYFYPSTIRIIGSD